MISYFSLFPEKYAMEIRTVAFPNHPDMPSGSILFNEFYCPDQNCNCERVLIRCDQVLDQNSAPKATRGMVNTPESSSGALHTGW